MTRFGNNRRVSDGNLEHGDATTFPGDVTFEGIEALAFDYVATVAIEQDPPRAVVSEVVIRQRPGGPPVTARRVASELGRVRHEAVAMNTVVVADAPDGKLWDGDPISPAARAAASGLSTGPPPVERAELERVARAYRKAQKAGRSTTAAVAAAVSVSSSTARKRVMQARAIGLLPPAGGTTRPKL